MSGSKSITSDCLIRGVLALFVVALLAIEARAVHAKRVSSLPTCRSVLASLKDAHIAGLRDMVQVMGQHARKRFHWSSLLHRKQNPSGDLGQQFAYNTSKTVQELQDLLSREENSFKMAEAKTQSLIETYKTSGLVPQTASFMDVQKCVYGHTNPHLYEYRPRVSFMMQYFRRPWMITRFVDRLRSCQELLPIELVVNVDSPDEHEQWANASKTTGGMVVPVFSANIHEIRAYNRLAHIARGDILIIMADDDLPPEDCNWLGRVVQLFERWPDVGVVGIRNYVHCWDNQHNSGKWFVDPTTGHIAHWVQRVDMAPMALRHAAYISVGGMDETMSEPGECGIISDWEICHRMWVAGWQVMASEQVKMEPDGHTGGTHTSATATRCWEKQQGTSGQVMSTRTDTNMENEMCEAARQLNLKHLKLIDPAKCPYEEKHNGCKL